MHKKWEMILAFLTLHICDKNAKMIPMNKMALGKDAQGELLPRADFAHNCQWGTAYVP